MQQDTEIPDIRFWGLKVGAGKPATYSIENDLGMLELCHLTNVALVTDSTASKPIYVRVRSPDDEAEYTLGALVPGRIYSFSADLMITPDTTFSHTGAAGDEVHLTGYRSISAEAMIDDFQDSGDEDSSDEEGSSEDEDFIAADGSYEEGASSEDDGSDDAGSGDDGTAVEAALRRKMKQKVAVAMQQAGPVASINGATGGKRRIAPESIGNGDALESDSGSEEDGESESDLDLGSFDDEENEGAEAGGAAHAQAVGRAQEQQRRIEVQKARQRALQDADDGDDFDIPMRDAGESSEEDVSGSDGEGQAAGHERHLARELAGKDSMPFKTAAATPEAKGVDKKARKREEASPGGAAPQKKAKTAAGKEGREQASTGALPEHPEEANAATREYAEQLVAYLRENGGEYKMSQLGVKVKRPEGAHKMGKVLKTYGSWFRRSGDKGQELMVLRLK